MIHRTKINNKHYKKEDLSRGLPLTDSTVFNVFKAILNLLNKLVIDFSLFLKSLILLPWYAHDIHINDKLSL